MNYISRSHLTFCNVKHSLTLLFFLLAISCLAQQSSSAEDLQTFVPKGYKLLFQYEADLNQDSLKDKIIVVGTDRSLGDSALRAMLPSGTNLQTRPVIILIGKTDHTYKRVTRNDLAVAQALGNIDPFSTIRCGIGFFIIEHTITDGSLHCTIASRFEWVSKQSDWYLKNYSHTCINTAAGSDPNEDGYKEKTPKNFGKITFGKYKYPMDIEIDEWGQ
jgi:hypothetical protein